MHAICVFSTTIQTCTDIILCACRSQFNATFHPLQSRLRPLSTHHLYRNTISLHLYLPVPQFFQAEHSGFRINLKTDQFLMLDIDANAFLEGSALPWAKSKLDGDRHQLLIILVDIKVLREGSRLPRDWRTLQIFPRRSKMLEMNALKVWHETNYYRVHLGITRTLTIPLGRAD